MKIGLSLSRCVRDIVNGQVDISDVLVIIARTDFDPRNADQWEGIWKGYGGGQTLGSPWSQPEWNEFSVEDEDRVRSVCVELLEQGKLHQPRQFGAHPRRRNEIWLEAILPSSELERNPAAKSAWEQFQLVAALTDVKINNKYQ
jgi:hypothetical protein